MTMTQEKKIEDYLHLYFGCECVCSNVYNYVHQKETLTSGILNSFYSPAGYIGNIKPLLRPLNDMTKDEATEIAIIHKYDIPDAEGVREELIGIYDCKEGETLTLGAYLAVKDYLEGLLHLLKNGFDLFGLIESGLALDKTKINQ